MFEALERAKRRDAGRRTKEDLKPPVVTSLNDIRRIIAEYDPEKAKDGQVIRLTTTLKGEDEKGKIQLYKVSAETRSRSKRTMLLEGFTFLQRQAESRNTINTQAEPISVNGRPMLPPRLSDAEGAVFIDPLIRQWMGAERRGMLICWELDDDYTYRYDIITHKLTRVKRDSTPGDAAAS